MQQQKRLKWYRVFGYIHKSALCIGRKALHIHARALYIHATAKETWMIAYFWVHSADIRRYLGLFREYLWLFCAYIEHFCKSTHYQTLLQMQNIRRSAVEPFVYAQKRCSVSAKEMQCIRKRDAVHPQKRCSVSAKEMQMTYRNPWRYTSRASWRNSIFFDKFEKNPRISGKEAYTSAKET